MQKIVCRISCYFQLHTLHGVKVKVILKNAAVVYSEVLILSLTGETNKSYSSRTVQSPNPPAFEPWHFLGGRGGRQKFPGYRLHKSAEDNEYKQAMWSEYVRFKDMRVQNPHINEFRISVLHTCIIGNQWWEQDLLFKILRTQTPHAGNIRTPVIQNCITWPGMMLTKLNIYSAL